MKDFLENPWTHLALVGYWVLHIALNGPDLPSSVGLPLAAFAFGIRGERRWGP